MTTRNFRVNNGLEVGDIVISANANTITGGATAAPNADGQFANKKYVDDQISAISTTAITVNNTNATVSDSGSNGTLTVTCDGNTELTITDTAATFSGNVIITGDLEVNGTNTIVNTSTLEVEDNIIAVNRNISAASGMPVLSGLKVNRGETSSATEEDLFWVWDESFADDGTTTYGNAGGAFSALRASSGADNASEITISEANLVDIRCNVIHATATAANYSDVGERFEADAPMAEGAVVTLGGEAEITETTSELQDTVFGVVSTMPALRMNNGAGNDDSHPFIAMTGRVPVRVQGTVEKGQRLVSSSVKGTARAVATGEAINPFHVIGRALESKTDSEIGLVNCVVRTND